MHDDTRDRLTTDVLEYAYRLDRDNLEAVARALGQESWHALTTQLSWESYDAGHDMGMLGAASPDLGVSVSLTDGEIGFPNPAAPGNFSVVIFGPDWEDDLYFVSALNGAVNWRGGRMVTEERVPSLTLSPLA